MLAACARRNSRQLGPLRRGAGSSFAWASSRRMLVGDTRKPSLASSPQIRRWDSRVRAATPTPALQPTAVADHGGRQIAAATSAAQAPDANETASAASPKARPTTTAAGDKRRPPAGLDQPRQASAAPLGGGESRARAVTPAVRGLSHAARGGYEPAHPAEPEQRDRGRRRPCRRSSQPSPDEEVTPILALAGRVFGSATAASAEEHRRPARGAEGHVSWGRAIRQRPRRRRPRRACRSAVGPQSLRARAAPTAAKHTGA